MAREKENFHAPAKICGAAAKFFLAGENPWLPKRPFCPSEDLLYICS